MNEGARIYEALAAVSPGLLMAAILIVAFLVYWFRFDDPSERRRPGSPLLPAIFVDFAYWAIEPLIDFLERKEIRPNHITAFSLYLAVLSAVALGAGHLMVGCWGLVATAICDLIDGRLARRADAGSRVGAFFDSFADRQAEAVVLIGLAYWGQGEALTWLAIWALVASYGVSYARARGEGLGVDCKIGLMQRPERLFWTIGTLFVGALVGILWRPEAVQPGYLVVSVGMTLLALMATWTVVERARWIMKALRDSESESSEPSSESSQLRSVDSSAEVEA